jgi:hypothetical protein
LGGQAGIVGLDRIRIQPTTASARASAIGTLLCHAQKDGEMGGFEPRSDKRGDLLDSIVEHPLKPAKESLGEMKETPLCFLS